MANKFPHILNEGVLTVYVNGDPYQMDTTNSAFDDLVELLNDDATEPKDVIRLFNSSDIVNEALKGKAEIVNGVLIWDGYEIHSTLGRRVAEIVKLGLDVEPWLKFVENLYTNPSDDSRKELYLFLEKHILPITEDGHFLAYKKVRGDYMDCYSGTFDNSVGKVCEMNRDQVDDNRDRTCSRGLHFCSRDYLRVFGGERTMVVKINPADVVSIPSDYDNSKGRCWRYEVVGEIKDNLIDTIRWDPVIYNDEDPEDDFEEEDFEDDSFEVQENELTEDEFDDLDDDPYDDDPYNENEDVVYTDAATELVDRVESIFENKPVAQPAIPKEVQVTKERSRSLWDKIRGK